MDPTDFAAWVDRLKLDRGLSERQICELLGCGINQISVWRGRQAPRYIALACAAISYGLPPWRDPDARRAPSLPPVKPMG